MKISNLFFIITCLFIVFLSTLIGRIGFEVGNWVYISLLLLVFPVIFKDISKINFQVPHLIFILILLIFSLVSSVLNSDISLFVSAVLFCFIFVIGYYLINFIYSFDKKEQVFIVISIFFPVIILVFCFINDSSEIPFRAGYDNPNTLGGMLASALIIQTALIFGIFDVGIKKYKLLLFIQVLLYIIVFYYLTLTVSRTSIITPVLVFFIMYIFFNIKYFLHSSSNKFFKFNILIFSSLLLVYAFFPVDLLDNFLNKFDSKSTDVLDMRGYIWTETIANAGFFGNGNNYFVEKFSLGAHSSFISILGRFGYIVFFIIVFSWLFLGLKVVKFSLSNTKNIYLYIPLAGWLGFTILSFTEIMFYKPLMMVFFMSLFMIVPSRVSQ